MSSSKLTPSELRDLWDKMQEMDDESKMQELIEGLTEEDLDAITTNPEMQKVISPYSFPTIKEGKYASFSLHNLKEDYMKREVSVSLAGFMYRMLDEYDEVTTEEKAVIKKFMGKYLEFNPDIHVKTSYRKKVKTDTTRADLASANPEFIRHILPEDTFYRWKLYNDANYDAIRGATQILYNDRPDLEFAAIVYNVADSENEAKEFNKRHQSDFKSDVFVARLGKWAFISPFKENRERVEIYSRESSILEDLLQKKMEDLDLAQDMMKNRIKREKKRNIEKFSSTESEQDIEKDLNEFKMIYNSLEEKGVNNLSYMERRKYFDTRNAIDEIELRKDLSKLEQLQLIVQQYDQTGYDNLSAEEQLKYNKIKTDIFEIEKKKEMYEVPEGAIQVNVFETTEDGDFKRNIMYTQAESQEETTRRLKNEHL